MHRRDDSDQDRFARTGTEYRGVPNVARLLRGEARSPSSFASGTVKLYLKREKKYGDARESGRWGRGTGTDPVAASGHTKNTERERHELYA